MARKNFLDGELNLPQLEEQILQFWDEQGTFKKSLDQTKDDKPFTFYDGPPFATGLPHYGHILASTIKDVVPRYQTMNGRFVRRRWGWDCHGLPIEEIVERKLGISGKKQIEEIGIKKFNETCRSMVLQYVGEWRATIRRIARWVDFDNSYKTMDVGYMESVWWGFKQIYDKDLVYEGRKVLLYCPRCETPISNFEVAMDNSYKDVQEEAAFVKFKLKDPEKVGLKDQDVYFLAWTTTPWTLPGNVALAVGNDIKYVGIKIENAWYIIADQLVAPVLKDWLGSKATMRVPGDERTFLGKDLVGLDYEPLFDLPALRADKGFKKAFKVYAADFVNTEDGTGIVHTAVVYGEDDYALGVREGLPIVPLLDEKGHFNDKAPETLRGVYFKGAEKIIKAELEQKDLLTRHNHTHSYPFCWRCGTQLFYNAIPAWFVNIQKIKPQLLKSNDKEINWFPEHLKHGRYEKSVEAAPDWNISRNRYWGNPIPAWKCTHCENIAVVGSVQELSEKTGSAKNNYWAIRHGESENILFHIIDSGDQNFHLTEHGRTQIAKAAKSLKAKKIDMIFASDLARTKESAEIIAEELGVKKIIFDKRLHEINLGSLSGKPSIEYTKRLPTQEERFAGRPEPDAESLRDVRTRAWGFLRDMEKKYKEKNILIVSHEDTIWMLSEIASGWSEGETAKKKTDNDNEFMKPAAILELDLKTIPRNDTGEVDLHRPYIDEIVFPCEKCGKPMQRTPEIFDSWVEAGSMPFAEDHYPFDNKKGFESRFPAQFVAEYIAQTRAWFYVMHVISVILFGKAPFENVVTTGTILAEDGSKMSKSKNNFPDPTILIEKYGADSLRFYLMNSVVMQADNLNFSEKGVEGVYRKVALLLANVYKYFATYSAEEVSAEGKTDAADANILDLWIRARTEELVRIVTESLDGYDTVRATRTIQEYVDDLSTWYLRRSRRRKDAAFFITMRETLTTTSKILAPFMPFLAEALYLELAPANAPASVHLAEWPKLKSSLPAKQREELMQGMAEVRKLASLALAKRAEAKIKVRQPLAMLRIPGAVGEKINDESLLAILADEVNVKQVFVDPILKEGVELDTVITPELRDEGFLREVSRMVQELRQKAGLAPKDRIALMMQLPKTIQSAIEKNEAALRSDVGAKTIEYKKSDKFDVEENTKIDGQEAWISLRKLAKD